MPAWIHNRAKHIRSKNPDMSESQSWAIATQQAHKLGKTPKNYGTAEGKATAMAKYRQPRKEYRKTADRVKKAAAIVRMEKAANAAAGYGPGAATPVQMNPGPNMVGGGPNPAHVPQAAPAQTPPVQIQPARTGPMPTANSGPSTMPASISKAGSDIRSVIIELHRRGRITS